MSTETETIEWFELAAYFEGNCSPERRAELERWMAASPERQAMVGKLRLMWQARQQPHAVDVDQEAIVAQVMASIRSPQTRVPLAVYEWQGWTSRARRHTSWRVGVASLAASLMIAAGVVGTVMRNHATPSTARVYHTGVMQRAVVTLADGSHVTLAPQTTLSVEAGYGATSRVVSLRGEAYFDVVSGPRAPFIVDAGRVRAQVLGTTFGVRSYGNEREVRLAVASGRISVVATDTSHTVRRAPAVVLTQGMIGRIGDSTTLVVQATAADVAEYARWTDGKLVFRDAPISEILAAVGQWYGYDFRVADSTVMRDRLTITIDSQSPEALMKTLKTMLEVSMTFGGKDGHVVTLHPQRATPLTQVRKVPSLNSSWSQPSEVGK